MKYLNKNFRTSSKDPVYKDMLSKMKAEVLDFSENFEDSPSKVSEWGHYYFCEDDGGRLIFDLKKPHEHKCEVCGKSFKKEVLDGVWVYFYRNRAVLTMWNAATLYNLDKDPKYLEIVKKLMGFYIENYTSFILHNKERGQFATIEEADWGCGRILPQGLNESIIMIRMISALELVKEDIGKEFLDNAYSKMFKPFFDLIKPQINLIHNIRCWMNSAVGIIGLFFNDKEMLDFVFKGEFNILRQLETGVTSDSFWYEGSIHYNFFTLEGITTLLMFAKIYDYPVEKEEAIVHDMFIAAYHYAFNNHFFPNPNDGWPSVNLKTYSYIYHMAAKIYGYDSDVSNILKIIENGKLERTTLPLSKPCYYGEISLERLILNTDMDMKFYVDVKQGTRNYPNSNYCMLRNKNMNVFMKYGMNGPSHAHPDLMNIEVMYKEHLISRDISNAGYRAKLCREWHRKSLAHNTVIRNGIDITDTNKGEVQEYTKTRVVALHKNVYDGVDYKRTINLLDNGFEDTFVVNSNEVAVNDYVFHLENSIKLIENYDSEFTSLGFEKNGYEHVVVSKKVTNITDTVNLNGILNNLKIDITLNLPKDAELFILKTLDNPVNIQRTSLLVRSSNKDVTYKMKLEMEEK